MPDRDIQSQSTIESNVGATTQASGSQDASIDSRITACDRLVDEAVEKGLSASALADSLKDLGLKAIEAINYIEEFNQRLKIRRGKAKQTEPPQPEHRVDASSHTQDHLD